MDSAAREEFELTKKHEDILESRALLLQQMEALNEQQKTKKKQQRLRSQAASTRNAQILKDLENVEKKLHTRQLLHPDIVHLETRYWASVEQKLPEWEQYLLGEGKAPVSETGTPFGQDRLKWGQQHFSPAHSRSKPPRPKPRK
ncbi:centrosomal protein 15 [Paramisgurnus dabryanus]|uniref:centrosomal protein 15 n=1 Tax=Paramisgurnus dabryanus TaxID=90735 RepID=UPI0031F4257C